MTGANSSLRAGQVGYTDPETGLVYLRARYSDPATGQFLTGDPLEAETGQPCSSSPSSNTSAGSTTTGCTARSMTSRRRNSRPSTLDGAGIWLNEQTSRPTNPPSVKAGPAHPSAADSAAVAARKKAVDQVVRRLSETASPLSARTIRSAHETKAAQPAIVRTIAKKSKASRSTLSRVIVPRTRWMVLMSMGP
jgi:uncharacterized protein RhaS with RHS repeats